MNYRRGSDPTTFPVAIAVISLGITVGIFLSMVVLEMLSGK